MRTLWPMVASAPMTMGPSAAVATSIELSCTLERGPIAASAPSAQTAAANHTLADSARRTGPRSAAPGATKAVGRTSGPPARPPAR